MEQKKVLHIESLKLKAIWNDLNTTGNLVRQKTVAIYADNSRPTVVACLLSQGGTKSCDLFVLVRDSLLWAEQRQVILVPQFISGLRNITADFLSRRNQSSQHSDFERGSISRSLEALGSASVGLICD